MELSKTNHPLVLNMLKQLFLIGFITNFLSFSVFFIGVGSFSPSPAQDRIEPDQEEPSPETLDSCDQTLAQPSPPPRPSKRSGFLAVQLAQQLRTELLDASERDRVLRPKAIFSSLHRNSQPTKFQMSGVLPKGDRALYLGSGPDIFKFLYLFPLVKHYHLLDIGTGWGAGFKDLFWELIQRLQSIAPEVEVTLVQKGFLRYRPDLYPDPLNPTPTQSLEISPKKRNTPLPPGPWKFHLDREGKELWTFYKKPCVWHLRWKTKEGKKQSRWVYFHPGDFDDDEFLQSVLKSMATKGGLGGVLLSAVALPKVESLRSIISHLHTGGIFITTVRPEETHTHFQNQSKGEDTLSTLEAQEADPRIALLFNQLKIREYLPLPPPSSQELRWFPLPFYVLKKE